MCLLLVIRTFILSNSALTQALTLVLYSIWIGVISGILTTIWLLALIVLVFRRGMMVIFLYLTRISAQDNNKFNPGNLALIAGVVLVYLRIYDLKTGLRKANLTTLRNYSRLNSLVVVLLCVYLLATLFCVFKVTQGFKGSLIINKFL